jgi:hypothetical protein
MVAMDKIAKILDLDSFALLGKEGSSSEGPGFVEKLWNAAERGLPEILPALKTDKFGPLYWGAMSSRARDLSPWNHDFKEGLYLAGFEMLDPKLLAPEKWVKWEIPARKYFVIKVGADYGRSFAEGLKALQKEGYVLSGAVFDHLAKGILYLYYPIEAIS